MGQLISIKISKAILNKVISYLKKQKGFVELTPASQYEALRCKIAEEVVVVYNSGKVVLNNIPKLTQLMTEVLSKVVDYDSRIIIGSDEVGKGEWLGPLVVCAVCLNRDQTIFLQANGIMDSKDLSLSRIQELAPLIKKNSLASSCVPTHPRRFNELMQEFRDEQKKLDELIAWAHSTAISKVYEKLQVERIKADLILIDEFNRYITDIRLSQKIDPSLFEIIQKPHAEEHIAVACASILAKSYREDWINRKSKELNLDLRSLTPKKALDLSFVQDIAKVSYINKLR